MRKPFIGIVCGLYQNERSENTPYYAIPAAYTKAIAEAGGLPVLIAPNIGELAIREIYERLDGVLIAGGGDVDPACYGMTADNLVHGVDPLRDRAEIDLTRWSAADDRPLLGICRGCQITNVALGGTLYRDIQTEYPGYNGLDHDLWGKVPRDYLAHSINIRPETHLASLLGESVPQVNSLHHQALRDVAPPLSVSATADDGLIEGVEIPQARFFVGVQWHPEELTDHSEAMRRLFAAFVKAAAHK